jgi:hypothetical protein
MNTTHSVRFHLLIAGLALALLSTGCATAPKAERYVAPPLGSTFTTSQSNTGSYGSGNTQSTMKVTERMWEGKRVTALVSPTGVLVLNADGAWSALLGPDDKPIVSWDPPVGPDYPLEIGKAWTKSYRVTVHATKQAIPFDMTGKVEAYEDVTLPAGTFKAFKISFSDTLGGEQMMWFIPELGLTGKRIERRTAKSQSGLGTRESELISYTIAK